MSAPLADAQPFFVLGGIKCGTTFLYNNLKQHPDLCMSRPKEPEFFPNDNEYDRGRTYYESTYFDHFTSESAFGDSRTNNLYLPWVPERIHSTYPQARLIVSMRDPVKRAHSDYFHARRHASEDLPFSEAIVEDYKRIKTGRRLMTERERQNYQEIFRRKSGRYYRMYLDGGYYREMVSRYLRYFDRNSILFLKFENLISNPLDVCNRIFDFLDVDPLESLEKSGENKGRIPKSYWLQSLYRSLGELPLAKFIPNPLKNRLMQWNLQPKTENRSMAPLTKLWLASHYEPHNRALDKIVPFSVESWLHPRRVLRDVSLDLR